MRFFLSVTLLLAVVGCGAPEPKDCLIEGLLVRVETYASCNQVAQNLALAKRYLDEAGLVPAGEFGSFYQGMKIELRYEDRVSYVLDDGTVMDDKAAFYDPRTDDIVLSKYGKSLLHELLHAYDCKAGIPMDQNDGHAHWEIAGYRALDAKYKDMAPNLDE